MMKIPGKCGSNTLNVCLQGLSRHCKYQMEFDFAKFVCKGMEFYVEFDFAKFVCKGMEFYVLSSQRKSYSFELILSVSYLVLFSNF